MRILSDQYGIQVRGGCFCAGTYGHFLLNVTPEQSCSITEKIDAGDLSEKPGWVRLSLHPTMTEDDVLYIIKAISEVAIRPKKWEDQYWYSSVANEFYPTSSSIDIKAQMERAFEL